LVLDTKLFAFLVSVFDFLLQEHPSFDGRVILVFQILQG